MAKVRLVNVVKKFGKVVAVDHVSFDVRDGEFFALLGPSGCGKTTTLRLIAGLEVPDEGEIWIDDKLVNDLPPKDRDIAMVFQNYALYPHMTVYENIAFPLMVRKRELSLTNEEIRRRVTEIAKLLQIDHLLNRKPSQLSGGEQQRVALARTLVRRPKVWLLDEPMSNLDAKLRVTMRGELKKLQKELGVTTIYVTHDQVEAMSMADRIAVMNKGRILQIGTPDELFWKPADTFVATFIGSPPMNIIECSVEERDRSTRLNCEEFSLGLAGVLADAVKKRTSDKVFLGIRPDHMTISKTRSNPESIEGTVTITEKLGANQIVYVNIAKEGAKIIRVIAPGEITFNPGEKVYVTLDMNRIYVFDGVTQKALI